MRLSDVMSAANLAVYAEIGLVLFLGAFLGVVAKVMLTKTSAYEHELNIPFEDAQLRDAVNQQRRSDHE